MSSITKSNNSTVTVGVALDGAGWHPAAWRESSAQPTQLLTAAYWQGLLVAADIAGIDYATLEDQLQLQPQTGSIAATPAAPNSVNARLDAVMVASWVAPHTTTIGIVPTVTTTHTEPFHVATGLQTLDHISEGRAGWQVRISSSQADADAFGRKTIPDIDRVAVSQGRADTGLGELLDEAADAVEVARRLWDSWEDDAIIRDASTGRFLDRDRVHHINFESDHFAVVGPSIVPRSPQGQLPVMVLAHTPQVIELAARTADVVFITPENTSVRAGGSRGLSTSAVVQLVREAEARVGRSPQAPLKIIADLVVVLDAAAEPGAESGTERLDRLNHAAGEPFESDARILVGSAEDVADLIADWQAQGIDGVRLRPAALPADLTAITRDLMPVLRERGLIANLTEDAGPEAVATESPAASAPSLRDRLGLPAPVNRYATPRAEAPQAKTPQAETPRFETAEVAR